MATSHKIPHRLAERTRALYRRVSWWPVLGLMVIALGGYTYYQISNLTTTVGALSVALTAEQNDKVAEGGKPVAPTAGDIVDDPKIIPGKPGESGRDGRDGVDGKNGIDGKDGRPGKPGTNGEDGDTIEGEPGEPGTAGVPGIGVDGANGKDGTNGKDGKEGVNGVDGTDGEDGKPPASWTWQMGSIEYTCSRAEDFDPANPKYNCSGTPILQE